MVFIWWLKFECPPFTTLLSDKRQDREERRKAPCFGLKEVIRKWGVRTGRYSGHRDTRCQRISDAGVRKIHYSTALYSVSTAAKCFVWSCGSGRPLGSDVPVPSRPGLLRSAPALCPEPAVWGGFTVERRPGPCAWAPASATERLCCGIPRWQAAVRQRVSTVCHRTRR